MMIGKSRQLFGPLAILSMLVASCGTKTAPTASEVLESMGTDAQAYARMDTCTQVRLFTDLGASYLEHDHSLVVVPDWMHEQLARGARPEVAECLASEGTYRLRLWESGLDAEDESLNAIYALMYEAELLKLVDYGPMQAFAHLLVCEADRPPGRRILDIYYFSVKHATPPYFLHSDAEQKMLDELCH